MALLIDNAPIPIPPSIHSSVESLAPGESLLVSDREGNIRSIRTIVSRIKRRHPQRKFKCSDTPDGPRVWRVA